LPRIFDGRHYLTVTVTSTSNVVTTVWDKYYERDDWDWVQVGMPKPCDGCQERLIDNINHMHGTTDVFDDIKRQVKLDERLKIALKLTKEQIGKPFDYKRLYIIHTMGTWMTNQWLRDAEYPTITNTPSWFCSELVAACLAGAGLLCVCGRSPSVFTPQNIHDQLLATN
jgi:hypothetical protein